MAAARIPPVRLYGRPGCHLCEETHGVLRALLDERRAAGLAAPALEHRDITTSPAWEAAYFETIPVVELAGREIPLATSPAGLRRLLSEVLDSPVSGAT